VEQECQPAAPSPDSVGQATTHRRALSLDQYIDGILVGDRAILARAITLIESSRTGDRALAEQIVEACLPHSGSSIRIGITGVPGAGKSSLIEALGTWLIGEHGEKVAVLAIDPSSQVSGGSILGDKTRMTSLASSNLAFIRPSPARGSFGGVAQHTREAMLLCEAAGYRNILVETVGVGQSETAVHEMVDFFLLILLAGAGDELQGIKRGVMELADAVVINKADGPNLHPAEKARAEAQNALHYLPRSLSGWVPPVLLCSALTGKGIGELWKCVEEHSAQTKENGWLVRTRREQAQKWMHDLIQQGLQLRFESQPEVQRRMLALDQDVLEGRITSFRAARELLDAYVDIKSEIGK
jgi:LAO/AO transport system kinase